MSNRPTISNAREVSIIISSLVVLARVMTGQDDVSSEKYLNRVAAETNKDLPMMIDEDTELYSVVSEEGLLSTNYRAINYTSEEFKQIDADALWEEARSYLTSVACTHEESQPLLDGEVTLRFTYVDKYFEVLESIDVTKSDCV